VPEFSSKKLKTLNVQSCNQGLPGRAAKKKKRFKETRFFDKDKASFFNFTTIIITETITEKIISVFFLLDVDVFSIE